MGMKQYEHIHFCVYNSKILDKTYLPIIWELVE